MRRIVHFHAALNAWTVDANLARIGRFRRPDLREKRRVMVADRERRFRTRNGLRGTPTPP